MKKIDNLVKELVDYAERVGLSEADDRSLNIGTLMDMLGMSDYSPDEENVAASKSVDGFVRPKKKSGRALSEILEEILDYAVEKGIINDGVVSRDLFDTKLMGVLTEKPSSVNAWFKRLYEKVSAEAATDYFYKLARDSNYIRRDRIARDVKWAVETEYGSMEISINLSKPEKDPKAIAAAKLLPQTDYPKCALCHENVGFAGSLAKPARQTLRQIPFDMAGERWYLQYSPYVYYNEHCIALSEEHRPMCINRSTFVKLLGFVEHFPHYFIGSNADLPIVGGSILTHDHMQGGRYTFSIENAEHAVKLSFPAFPEVEAGIVKWPMSVLRLTSYDPAALIELADRILTSWREYSDPEREIVAYTEATPHNTITPIARRRGERFELDLVLRNNRTTDEHPLGIFHPHAEHHNIKKENIGLIEVMGLAILPARLKSEMAILADLLSDRVDVETVPEVKKHAEWVKSFSKNYVFTSYNVDGILKTEIGKTFVRVLSDAGVYKDDDDGREGFLKFLGTVGGYRAE